MNSINKKHILIILLVFFVGREFVPFELTWYRSNLETRTNSSSNTSSSISSIFRNAQIDVDKSETVHMFFPKIEEGDFNCSGKTNCLEVYNSYEPRIDLGRFVPFYKQFNFSTNCSYSFNTSIRKNDKVHQISFSGSITIEGEYTIMGLCSGKKASALAITAMNQEIKENMMDKLIDKIKDLD